MGQILSLAYTRPKRVDTLPGPDAGSGSDASIDSGRCGSSAGIPDSLAFDSIMNGGTCPPMTVRDLMNFLIYIEHSAENLQFWLWYKDYAKRFHSADTLDIALAPQWSQAMEEDVMARIRKEHAEKLRPEPRAASMFKGTDFEKQTTGSNPFNTPPRTPRGGGDGGSLHTAPSTAGTGPSTAGTGPSYQSLAAEAFVSAGVKQPFSIQPFRDEMDRVMATYMTDGAPRQLNLSSWQQKAALHALSHTTHPSALRAVFETVDSTLRHQAHPNFVRWSICNGNPARVSFARALGASLVVAGVAIGVLTTLGSLGRGFRALAAAALVPGISTLVAAHKGMCVVLHGLHRRHVRPWELFVQDDGEDLGKRSFDLFGPRNSYKDEPWVVRYQRRGIVRKIFDRDVWIHEPALRQIQDTIFVQAVLASLLPGGALTAIFVAVPGGSLW